MVEVFVTGRMQTVVVEGEHSDEAKVSSGVKQGMILYPVLFLIYPSNLEEVVKHSIISSFADDTRLLKDVATH